jgi:hypothetical protein
MPQMVIERNSASSSRPRTASRERDDDLVALAPHVVESSISSYLRDGWRQEQVVLERVECGPSGIRGQLTFSNYERADGAPFHVSALQVMIWVQQLGIIYTCQALGATKDEIGQVYLREVALRFRHPIHDPKDIGIEMRPSSCRLTRQLFFCSGAVDVGNGAIVGELLAVARVPARRNR